jgi:hypothetical protein
MFDHDTVLVVSSCDAFEDLWHPFFTLLFRYWPDCPFPVILVSNFREYRDPRVKTISIGKDKNWSTGFARALRRIESSKVIVLLEDYLLTRTVNTGRILQLIDYMNRRRAACLRLCPSPEPNVACSDNAYVGEISPGAPYRLSLQAAIWDRRALLRLLRWGESPWELELLGSRRTDSVKAPFLSVKKSTNDPVIDYLNAVVRGRWQKEAVEFCKNQGISLDPLRPVGEEQHIEPKRSGFRRRTRRALHRRLRIIWHRP